MPLTTSFMGHFEVYGFNLIRCRNAVPIVAVHGGQVSLARTG
jgi:hypothetical protein